MRTADEVETLLVELSQRLEGLSANLGSKKAAARVLGVSNAHMTRASSSWVASNSPKNRPAFPQTGTLRKLIENGPEDVVRIARQLLEVRQMASTRSVDAPDVDFHGAAQILASIGQVNLLRALGQRGCTTADLEFNAAVDLLTAFANVQYCVTFAPGAARGIAYAHPFGLDVATAPVAFRFESSTSAVVMTADMIKHIEEVLQEVHATSTPTPQTKRRKVAEFDTVMTPPLYHFLSWPSAPLAKEPSSVMCDLVQSQALEQAFVAHNAAIALICGDALRETRLQSLCRAIATACRDRLPMTADAFLASYRRLLHGGGLPNCEDPYSDIFMIGFDLEAGALPYYSITWMGPVSASTIRGIERPFNA